MQAALAVSGQNKRARALAQKMLKGPCDILVSDGKTGLGRGLGGIKDTQCCLAVTGCKDAAAAIKNAGLRALFTRGLLS